MKITRTAKGAFALAAGVALCLAGVSVPMANAADPVVVKVFDDVVLSVLPVQDNLGNDYFKGDTAVDGVVSTVTVTGSGCVLPVDADPALSEVIIGNQYNPIETEIVDGTWSYTFGLAAPSLAIEYRCIMLTYTDADGDGVADLDYDQDGDGVNDSSVPAYTDLIAYEPVGGIPITDVGGDGAFYDVGTPAPIAGTGFLPNEAISLMLSTLDGTSSDFVDGGAIMTDNNGYFGLSATTGEIDGSATYTIPTSYGPGQYTLIATGVTSGRTFTSTVTIAEDTPPAPPAPPADDTGDKMPDLGSDII